MYRHQCGRNHHADTICSGHSLVHCDICGQVYCIRCNQEWQVCVTDDYSMDRLEFQLEVEKIVREYR